MSDETICRTLRLAADAAFLAMPESVAEQVSKTMTRAADRIDELERLPNYQQQMEAAMKLAAEARQSGDAKELIEFILCGPELEAQTVTDEQIEKPLAILRDGIRMCVEGNAQEQMQCALDWLVDEILNLKRAALQKGEN